jgi:hypothetical protein
MHGKVLQLLVQKMANARPWQQALVSAILLGSGVALVAFGQLVGVAFAAVGVLMGVATYQHRRKWTDRDDESDGEVQEHSGQG